jgi:peptide deformylase
MIHPILKYGAPELRAESEPVDYFNKELEEIVKNLFDTMYGAPGIGLAAAQIGINIRLATVDLSVGKDSGQRIILCNPEIISTEGEQRSDEGCLSIPEFTDTVSRPQKIVVRGLDHHGEEITIEAEGLLAKCLSHEIDHMKGVLFIDHLSPLKRSLIRNKIKKLAKAGEWK